MGFVIFYALLILCWLVPPFLISRSEAATGWSKARWVIGCFMSAVLPLLLGVAGIALAVHFAGYQRDAKAIMFGPEAILSAIVNVVSLVLPWIVYLVFKKWNAQGSLTQGSAESGAPRVQQHGTTRTFGSMHAARLKPFEVVIGFSIVIGLVLMLLLGIPAIRKARADRLVDELCAKDGGMKVYEVVELPAGFSVPRTIPFKRYKKTIDPFYFVSSSQDIKESSSSTSIGDLVVYRTEVGLIRASEEKLLGTVTIYSRRGGDGWGAMHPSSYSCQRRSEWDLAKEVVRAR